jgi:hypothetical protein
MGLSGLRRAPPIARIANPKPDSSNAIPTTMPSRPSCLAMYELFNAVVSAASSDPDVASTVRYRLVRLRVELCVLRVAGATPG